MAQRIINIGAAANDRKGDSLRAAFKKINSNFDELYSSVMSFTPETDTIETVGSGGTSGDETILNLTKKTHVLKDGWYMLLAGTEGQIMYFVPHSSVTDLTGITIRVNNGRYNNGVSITDYSNNYIAVFSGQSGTAMSTAIYADGAWQFNVGTWD